MLAGSHTLIIGSPDGSMINVGDGFYKYDFTVGLGFDATKNYVFRSDGGGTLPPGERYHVGSTEEVKLTPETIQDVVNGVWDETAVTHIAVGSMGLLQNQAAADASSAAISAATAVTLLQTLLKYDTNRTKIDKIAKTLTVYDNDGTTPLKVFALKDGTGAPSIIEVCERVPTP